MKQPSQQFMAKKRKTSSTSRRKSAGSATARPKHDEASTLAVASDSFIRLHAGSTVDDSTNAVSENREPENGASRNGNSSQKRLVDGVSLREKNGHQVGATEGATDNITNDTPSDAQGGLNGDGRVNKKGDAKKKASANRRTAKRKANESQDQPFWSDYSDKRLLDMRICDLKLSIEGPLAARIERLYFELEQRGLRLRPHCWLSDDWYSPNGVPGIAIPFYMAHRRLQRLERAQLLEVEGGTEEWCMRILRHEAGHAIDTAFNLYRKRRWQAVFGKSSKPYPDHYLPKPHSKDFVLHLESWYAQSHPSEDFAETFAVWLKPRSRWRAKYKNWPALNKLEFVNELMEEIRGQAPKVKSRLRVDPIRKLRSTLREHYEEKRARYGIGGATFYDFDLQKLFSSSPEYSRNTSASAFLRRIRKELREVVAHWTGQHLYMIDQILSEMIDRCRELRLRIDRPWDIAKRDAQVMLTVQTMNYLHRGHHKIAL